MEHTNQGLDVFRKYISTEFQLKRAFSSPLREDRNPSFNIFFDDVTRLYRYKDFATDEGGDAIQFVSKLYSLDFNSSCRKIGTDFGISLRKETPEITRKTHPQSKLEIRQLNENEFRWWSKIGIDAVTLDRYNVKATQYSTIEKPAFCYTLDWGNKIYQPQSEPRFYYDGKPDEAYIFGQSQLSDKGLYLILTAGEKDCLSLAARGYNAISLNSESTEIPIEFIAELSKRFRYLLICYDTDEAGRRASKKHLKKHPTLIGIQLPLDGSKASKDVTDYFQKYQVDNFNELIKASVHGFFERTLKELSGNKFDFNQRIAEPIPICTIEDQKILTSGNITVVAGKVKSGKSALVQSVISGSIALPEIDRDKFFLGIDVMPNLKNLAVIHFDTEQSSYDYSKKLRNTIYNAGYDDNVQCFHSFHLLEFSPWERLRYIEHVCQYYSIKHGGIYLIVIDGVADLVSSVNDEMECNRLVDTLHRIATDHQAAVLCVLHLNPDGFKTRGHLGSQLDRKAESVLVVEKTDDVCTINPKYCRNASFGKIGMPQFSWHAGLNRFVFDGSKSYTDRLEKKVSECEDLLIKAKQTNLIWDRNKLREYISYESEIKRSAAYELINFMLANNQIKELANGSIEITL